MSGTGQSEWVCCHLGAREHYVVPRALHRRGRLRALITDTWVKPGSMWSRLPGTAGRRLSERFHADLDGAVVRAFTLSLAAREMSWRLQPDGWTRLINRNQWFGRRAAHALRGLEEPRGRSTVVFAHSYSARDVFAVAKSRSFTTVLGQIDPGEEHFKIVQRLAEESPEYGEAPAWPPPSYFETWRDECRLADSIVVNSEWSRELVERSGIPSAKVHVIPLLYAAGGSVSSSREYPHSFTRERPLRVLFVGHVAVAKGAAVLLEAMPLLKDLPLELRMVGAVTMRVPAQFINHSAIRWVGPVSRHDVMAHYRDCDVLIFPSFSDGFGMAQIEAQAFRLPIIASRSCGGVVRDGVNGVLLDEPTPEAIARAIRRVAGSAPLLARFAQCSNAVAADELSPLASALIRLAPA